MVELIAKTPCDGSRPFTIGDVTLAEEVSSGALTSLSPFGDPSGLSGALQAAYGFALPGPNRATGKEGARCIWFGLREVLLMGAVPDHALGAHAAVVDQSDGWSVLRLSGQGAEDILARLVPVDFRIRHFKRRHTVRSQVGHMNASITRIAADGFLIIVFRSMAGTLVHELKTAMEAVASRR